MARRTYKELVAEAAVDMAALLWDGSGAQVLLYARPTTLEKQGALIVTREQLPPPHVVVRGLRDWRSYQRDALFAAIYDAARKEAIL